MLKRITVLALLIIAGSAQAITWNEYYQAHEKEVIDEVEKGELDLRANNLTDLIGFAQTPSLNKLKRLYLNFNRLTSLAGLGNLPVLEVLELQHNRLKSPVNIKNLDSLEVLDLSENQLNNFTGLENLSALQVLNVSSNQLNSLEGIENLPSLQEVDLRENKLASLAGIENYLPKLKELNFEDNPMPDVEKQLIDAVKNGQDLIAVQRWFTFIRDAVVQVVNEEEEGYEKINIPSIQDDEGNNILHIVVQTAAQRLANIRRKVNSLELDEAERTRQIQKYSTAINDRYTKILNILLSCDEECVHEMLYAPNAQGWTVIESVLRRLGPDSPIYKIIQSALWHNREQEQKQRVAEEV